MNETLRLIKERRTIRKYKNQQIKKEELDEILEAGLWAPSAGGRQFPVMVVCQDQHINEELGKINKALFGGVKAYNDHNVNKAQISIAEDDSIISAFYSAPTVVYIFAPKTYQYSINDCSVVAQNMIIQAWSIGIGATHVGRAEATFQTDLGKTLKQKAGLGEEYEARICLCLGYPKGEIGTGIPRKEERIIHIK